MEAIRAWENAHQSLRRKPLNILREWVWKAPHYDPWDDASAEVGADVCGAVFLRAGIQRVGNPWA